MLVEKRFSTSAEIERRAANRVAFPEPCFAQTDTRALWVKGINISEGGMCIAFDQLGVMQRGIGVAMFILNYPAIDASVKWVRGNVAGLSFTDPIANHPDIQGLIDRLRAGEPAWTPKPKVDVDALVGDSVSDLLRPKSTKAASKDKQTSPPKSETSKRKHERHKFSKSCLVKTEKKTFRAEGLNLSEGGMCLRLTGLGALHNGTDVQIIFDDAPPIDATLRWSKERMMGFQFLTPIKGHPILQDLIPDQGK